jgi:hypothetical protein
MIDRSTLTYRQVDMLDAHERNLRRVENLAERVAAAEASHA